MVGVDCGAGAPLKLVLAKNNPSREAPAHKPPQVKTEPEDRAEKCPRYGSIYLHRHGKSIKPVKDQT